MEGPNTYYAVPAVDLHRLEVARKELCNLFEDPVMVARLANVTGMMWHLTHRKYKKATIWEAVKTAWKSI